MSQLSDKTDEELIALANEGSDDAAEILIKRMTSTVKKLAAEMNSSDGGIETDDLIQYGLLGVLSAIKNYNPDRGASFKTYAVTCMRNMMISALRKGNRRRRRLHEVSLEDLQEKGIEECGSTVSAETEYFSSERVRAIKDIIRNRLTDEERCVLEDRIEGLSYDKIAAKHHLTKKGADNAMQRARKKIANALGETNQ